MTTAHHAAWKISDSPIQIVRKEVKYSYPVDVPESGLVGPCRGFDRPQSDAA